MTTHPLIETFSVKESEEEEYDVSEYPQRVGRQKHILDIDFHFNDSRRGISGRGRGGRGNRGGNRGGGGGGGSGGGGGNRAERQGSRFRANDEQVSKKYKCTTVINIPQEMCHI